MEAREICESEVRRLAACIKALSDYHNRVSTYHSGFYPSQPCEKTMLAFEKAVKDGTSKIAVVERDESIAGFCKIDIGAEKGKLDYLVVLEQYRNSGLGKVLMDWAMSTFRTEGVKQIEVKVIDGNPAIAFYQKYGFQMNAHILWYTEEIQ